jgi:hypothetical protein
MCRRIRNPVNLLASWICIRESVKGSKKSQKKV